MRKIKNLLVICFTVLALVALASCGKDCEHETGSWAANAEEHWKVCGLCNEQVEKAAHAFGEFEVIAEPAVGIEGTKVRKCADCGYVDRQTIPAVVVETGVAEGDFAVYAKVTLKNRISKFALGVQFVHWSIKPDVEWLECTEFTQ